MNQSILVYAEYFLYNKIVVANVLSLEDRLADTIKCQLFRAVVEVPAIIVELKVQITSYVCRHFRLEVYNILFHHDSYISFRAEKIQF